MRPGLAARAFWFDFYNLTPTDALTYQSFRCPCIALCL